MDGFRKKSDFSVKGVLKQFDFFCDLHIFFQNKQVKRAISWHRTQFIKSLHMSYKNSYKSVTFKTKSHKII